MLDARIAPIFFFSGFASLFLQVVWFKQLTLVLGSSTFAMSVTVAAFFLGLGLGGALGGRVADRVARPLRAYGGFELGLGLGAPLITAFLGRWMAWVAPVAPWLSPESGRWQLAVVGFAFAVLLLPTTAMGATLPLLARFVVRSPGQIAGRVGLLYGLNTLGAAAGCAVVGFVAIGRLGVSASGLVGALIYVAIGVLSLWLSRDEPRLPPEPKGARATPGSRVYLLGFVVAANGFLSIAYEVLWFRMLRNFGHHTVYAFSAMLTVYLLGLVVGALICARWVAPRKESHLAAYAMLQAGTAAAATLSMAVLGVAPAVMWLLSAPDPAAGGPLAQAVDGTFALVGLTGLTVLLPTSLIGIGLPLATELVTERVGDVGSRVGGLYAASTLAGVLGSLLTAFVVLPGLGSAGALIAAILGNVGLFAVLLVGEASLRQDPRVTRVGVAMSAVAVFGVLVLGPRGFDQALRRFGGGQSVALIEETDATFLVMAYTSPTGEAYQQLLVNGESYANNLPTGRRYMALLGHLPVLAHPDPRRALVVCIGTGTTVGALSTWPSLEVDAVDLSQTVFDVAPHFVPKNHRFYENPRVNKIVADGRHFLLTTSRRYDVLTFEPPPPSDAGIVNLYSEEFYALARQRMNPGGIVAQWMPMDVGRAEVPRMMLHAMRAQFPHVVLFMGNQREGILLGSDQPIVFDPAKMAERLSGTPAGDDLAAVGFTEATTLFGTFIGGNAAVDRLIGDAATTTDDQPRIEYFNRYPPGRVTHGDVIAVREPLGAHVSSPVPPEALARAIQLADAVARAEEGLNASDFARIREAVASGQAIAPDDPLLREIQGSIPGK